jgi:hypothetical protein
MPQVSRFITTCHPKDQKLPFRDLLAQLVQSTLPSLIAAMQCVRDLREGVGNGRSLCPQVPCLSLLNPLDPSSWFDLSHSWGIPILAREEATRVARFPCTFCHKMISSKSWKRHEESQHMPVMSRWICMPQGSFRVIKGSDQIVCAFCGELDTHCEGCLSRIGKCLVRPLDKRTFHRKDQFKQHFDIYHKAELSEHVAEAWKVEGNAKNSSWPCGFCNDLLPGWDARAVHLSKHFRAGKRMEDWVSDRQGVLTSV